MKIKDAIKYLQDLEAQGETDIVMATWEKEAFEFQGDIETWNYFCDRVDDDMDWSGTQESLDFLLTEIINEEDDD
jgi:hypothetical protein